jgi:hypothetical protein
MLPDYGLEDLTGAADDEAFNAALDDDTFNDDTFGGASAWEQGNESALEMSRLHEQFLSGDLSLPPAEPSGGPEAGGFFGGIGDSTNDFLLEDQPSLGMLEALDDEPLSLDMHTEQLLDSPERVVESRATAFPTNRGLRVSGLPSSLDETQAKQVLTHFGPLARFELRRGAGTSTALLSYQDPSITDSARASLHGIPLGGRCAAERPKTSA